MYRGTTAQVVVDGGARTIGANAIVVTTRRGSRRARTLSLSGSCWLGPAQWWRRGRAVQRTRPPLSVHPSRCKWIFPCRQLHLQPRRCAQMSPSVNTRTRVVDNLACGEKSRVEHEKTCLMSGSKETCCLSLGSLFLCRVADEEKWEFEKQTRVTKSC